jgi:hypothetical protein
MTRKILVKEDAKEKAEAGDGLEIPLAGSFDQQRR